MTEAEWNTSADPRPMLEFLKGKATQRRLRLLACAYARRFSEALDVTDFQTLDIAEQFADGVASLAEVRMAKSHHSDSLAQPLGAWLVNGLMRAITHQRALSGVEQTIHFALHSVMTAADTADSNQPFKQRAPPEVLSQLRNTAAKSELSVQADLVRCAFSPFRRLLFNPAWLTATVQSLAQTIYEERAFDRMPILGDALEESGCSNADILNHCRQPGEYAKGCWVVDLLLGKK